ncbi:lysylphosphatidylglycerol synthase transmembrane domain-containing protein, partial [Nocardioides sp.]|uniref:lysylphosphatidylglycerol synthase transmembrane domain-containing protein n=1 Tax=Nocardioides sp. TaxID=35761 RepID=UPI00286E7B7C
AISRTFWIWARLLGGAAILVALVWRQGAGPFVDGVQRTSPEALLVALAVTAGTTLCCAWRWSLVAQRLGVAVPVRTAVAAYYRSQFLNATLPGGVLGDVHRGVSHGRETGAMGRGVRSVGWDRAIGQAVQAVLALGAVALLLPGVRAPVAVGAVVGLAVLVIVCFTLPRRARRVLVEDLRLLTVVWPHVVLASAFAAAGHVVVFVVAARTAGVSAPLPELAALALVVLLVSAVPVGIAGWGPREGAAAWVFGAVGLGAAQGLTVAVVYGVMALVATLPGVAVAVRRGAVPAAPRLEEAAHG